MCVHNPHHPTGIRCDAPGARSEPQITLLQNTHTDRLNPAPYIWLYPMCVQLVGSSNTLRNTQKYYIRFHIPSFNIYIHIIYVLNASNLAFASGSAEGINSIRPCTEIFNLAFSKCEWIFSLSSVAAANNTEYNNTH